MRREKGAISILALICVCLILVIIIGTVVYFVGNTDKGQENNTANKIEKNEESASNEVGKAREDKKVKKTHGNIDLWNGTYESDNGITITVYRTGESMLEVSVDQNDGETIVSKGFDVEYDSENSDIIEYEDSTFDEEYNIIIVKNGDELEVQSDSNMDDDILKKASGTYHKKKFENAGWDGMYKSDDYVIVLAQYGSDAIYVSFEKKYSTIGQFVEDFDDNKISFKDESFDEEIEFEVIKSDDGIKVVGSSSNEDSLLNEISGVEFEKILN